MKIASFIRFWRRKAQSNATSTSDLSLPHATSPPEKQSGSKIAASTSLRGTRANTHGLLPLHIPHPTNTPPSERQYSVDIIAIHGITGDAYSTWTNKDSSYFWLRDSLPEEFLGARIYSFGYRAEVVFSLETGDFDSFARDLLEEIHETRLSGEEKRRPLIFVCHSMGGIVVKKALNVCHIEPRYTHIISAVPSILFLSTPHGGSDPADLLAVIARVATIPLASRWLGRTRHELISALGRNSKELYAISKDFRHHTKNLKIFSFIEQTRTPPLSNLIVDEIRGSMRVDTEDVVFMPGCNHRTVCCFENEKSQGYNKVLSKLREVVEEATTKHENEIQAEDIPCLHSLAFSTMHDRLHSTSTAHPATCTWLLTHPSFQAWSDLSCITSKTSNLLWIKGNPGTGKSTLMAFLYNELANKSPHDIQLSFFFHADGTSLQKSPLGMLRSLIHQMYKWSPSARKAIFAAYDDKVRHFGQYGRHWDWEIEELQTLLSEVLCQKQLRDENVILFVDALDEVDTTGDSLIAAELVSYFHALNDRIISAGAKTKICISSRHYPVLATNQGFSINVEEFNTRDVAKYVEYQLRIGVEGWGQEVETARRELENAITIKSKGVFLWARFRVLQLVRSINDGACSLEEAPRLLDSESNDMSPIYKAMLLRNIEISLRPQALHFLTWVCLAERPLSVSELRFAMACDDSNVHEGQARCDDSDHFIKEDSRMKKLTKSLSGGLVEVRHGSDMTVQVFHQTVTSFLLTDGLKILAEISLPTAMSMSIDEVIGQAECRISRSCLNYLAFHEVLENAQSQVKGIEERLGLIRYAASYWLLHAERAERRGIEQSYILRRFRSVPKMFDMWKLINFQTDRWQSSRGLDMIHVASRANLVTVVKQLLDDEISIEEQDDEGFTPLHHAAQNGHLELTTMLLDRNANVEAKNRGQSTPLGCAAANGHGAIVSLLLKKGAMVNEDTGHTGTALQAAIEKGSLQLVRCLIDNGADINAKGGYAGSALQAAAYTGNPSIVSLLISKGADLNVSGGHLGSILHAAVMGGSRQRDFLIQLLLDAGADVTIEGGEYGNALQAAARRKLLPLVELFLKEGANVNSLGGKYGNALQAAASNESGGEDGEAIIPLLLKSGADVNALGGEYGTALQAAASCGDKQTVQLLLDCGAEINIEGGRFGSALQAAAASPGPEVVQLLLDNGALDLKGGVYGNVLQAAAYAGNFEVAKFALDSGVDINEIGGEYGSALQAAVVSGNEKLVLLLLESGADVNAQGGEYQNALKAAVFWNKEPLIKLLLGRGADPNNVARVGPVTYGPFGSPLHVAAARGRLSIVKCLLDNGADPNLQCDWAGNALGAAVSNEHTPVVQLLLERGADPTRLDQMYDAPFFIAEGNEAMTTILKKSKLKRMRSRDVSVSNAVDKEEGAW